MRPDGAPMARGAEHAKCLITALLAGAALGFVVQYRKYEKGNDTLVNWSLPILIITFAVCLVCGWMLWTRVLQHVSSRSSLEAHKAASKPFLPAILLFLYPLFGFMPVEIRFKVAVLGAGAAGMLVAAVDLIRNRNGLRAISARQMVALSLLFPASAGSAVAGNIVHNLQKNLACARTEVRELNALSRDLEDLSIERNIRSVFTVNRQTAFNLQAQLKQKPFLVFSLASRNPDHAPDYYRVRIDVETETGEEEFLIDAVSADKWDDFIYDLGNFENQAAGFRFRVFINQSLPRHGLLTPAWNWQKEKCFNLAMTPPRIIHGLASDKDFNVVLISLDTLRADHLSVYGYSRDTSPNLAQLAEEGIVFTNFFSPSTWTLPAHVSLFTSLYPSAHRVHNPQKEVKSLNFQTLAHLLRGGGYYTVAFTDSGFVGSAYKFHHGFDQFDERGYGIEENVDKACHWVRNSGGLKFFLFLHTFEIHDYFFLRPEHRNPYASHYDGRIKDSFRDFATQPKVRKAFELRPEDIQFMIDLYDGAIRYTDEALRKFFECLKHTTVYDDTMILVLSDHGESFNEFHNNGRSVAWHHGGLPYESMIHVPMVMKPPLHLGVEQKVLEGPYSLIDIMPTLAELLNLQPENQVQGVSFASALFGRESGESRPVISLPAQERLNAVLGVRTNDLKYIAHGSGRKELYNLRNDKREQVNLADDENFESELQTFSAILDSYLEDCEGFDRHAEFGEEIPENVRAELKALGYLQ